MGLIKGGNFNHMPIDRVNKSFSNNSVQTYKCYILLENILTKGCSREFLYNQITAITTICIEIPAYTLYLLSKIIGGNFISNVCFILVQESLKFLEDANELGFW